MQKDRFVYVTYIRTTPEKLWQALTDEKFTTRYWFEIKQVSDWKLGASWRSVNPAGENVTTGEIIEIDPPRRLVFTWRGEKNPEQKAEGYARVTYTLEPQATSVKLTILHEMDKPGTTHMQSVSQGWPIVLASLKSLLETGEPLPETTHYAPCGGKK